MSSRSIRAIAALVLVGALVTCGGDRDRDAEDAPPPATAGVTFLGIVFGQVLEEEAHSARLTPGKPASVRASIVGALEGIASPVVTLTASNGATTLGTLAMLGPDTLPTSVSGHDATQTFNAVLPGAWVRPGLTVHVSYTPAGSALAVSATDQPAVGGSTALHLVLVPIQIGSEIGAVPSSPFAVRDLLAMSFPYAHQDIRVDTRAPLPIHDLTELTSAADIGRVLAELEIARALENPGAVYYGLVPDAGMKATMDAGRRLVGVAHVNDAASPSYTWKLSALGTDSMAGLGVQDSLGLPWTWWARIMIHELGHVHGRQHAPCGDAGGVDPAFPYPGGTLGTRPIYASFYSDTTFGTVGAPTIPGTGANMTDVMGYCEGVWFSDYNYFSVQRFAERHSAAAAGAAAASRAASSLQAAGFLVLSGDIDAGGLALRPAFLSSKRIGDALAAGTDYELVIRTADDREFTQALTPYANSEVPERLSFRVSVPAGTRISRVELRKAGVAVPPGAIHEAAAEGGAVLWSRDAAGLTVRWDSTLEPYLSVMRITRQGAPTVLRLFASGGVLHVPAEEFAGAGIELQLGTQLNARALRAIAP